MTNDLDDTSVRSRSLHLDALRFIDTATATNGFPPSVREIGRAVGYASASSAQAVFNGLKKRAWISHVAHSPRAYAITDKGREALGE